MKNVLIIGAAGQIARVATDMFLKSTDHNLTLFLRDSYRLANLSSNPRVKLVDGDALQLDKLTQAMKGQDIVYANLSGDLEYQVHTILSAMNDTGVSRLIYVSSMGIYNEVPGEQYGSILEPYRRAANIIENTDIDYTIVRPAWLNNKDEISYGTTKKGESFKNADSYVSRKSVADFILKVSVSPDDWKKQSIGIHYASK